MIKKAKKQAECFVCREIKENRRSEYCDSCREALLKAKVKGVEAEVNLELVQGRTYFSKSQLDNVTLAQITGGHNGNHLATVINSEGDKVDIPLTDLARV